MDSGFSSDAQTTDAEGDTSALPQELLKKVAEPLPAVADIAPILLRRIERGSLTWAGLAELLGQDPILAFELLCRSNAAVSAEDNNVSSLAQAASLLGEDQIIALLKETPPPEHSTPEATLLCQQAIAVSLLAAELTRNIEFDQDAEKPQSLYWTTLIWGAPWWYAARYTTEAFSAAWKTGFNLWQARQAFRQVAGFSPAKLWEAIASQRFLPDTLQELGAGLDRETLIEFDLWLKVARGKVLPGKLDSPRQRQWLRKAGTRILLCNRTAFHLARDPYGAGYLESLNLLSLCSGQGLASLNTTIHESLVNLLRRFPLPGALRLLHRLLQPPQETDEHCLQLLEGHPEALHEQFTVLLPQSLPSSVTGTFAPTPMPQLASRRAEEEARHVVGQLTFREIQATAITTSGIVPPIESRQAPEPATSAPLMDRVPVEAPEVKTDSTAPEPQTQPESAPEESAPEESVREESAPEESAPEESAPEESAPEESAARPEPPAPSETVKADPAAPRRPVSGNLPNRRGDRTLFNQLINEMQLSPGSFTAVPQIMTHVKRCLIEGIGLPTCCIFLINQNRTLARAYFSHGTEERSDLFDLTLDLNDSALLKKLCLKQTSVWVKPSNWPRFKPSLPKNFLAATQTSDFFLMSNVVKNRPVAIFYADGGPGVSHLTDFEYEGFKQTCSTVALVLYNLASRKKARP